jgi:hypothetical protein
LTVRILFTIALTLGITALAPVSAGASPDEPTPTTVPGTIPGTIPGTVPGTVPDDVTIDTANPFLPDEVDLSQCVGTLPRPGCGSEERGGWHQNLVAIAMVAGLLIVFGRVAWGVRRNRRQNDIATNAHDAGSPDAGPVDDSASDDDAGITSSP